MFSKPALKSTLYSSRMNSNTNIKPRLCFVKNQSQLWNKMAHHHEKVQVSVHVKRYINENYSSKTLMIRKRENNKSAFHVKTTLLYTHFRSQHSHETAQTHIWGTGTSTKTDLRSRVFVQTVRPQVGFSGTSCKLYDLLDILRQCNLPTSSMALSLFRANFKVLVLFCADIETCFDTLILKSL